ncbi:SDR family oxidoreductase [Sphingomonas ginsenosidivorax]|uniref:SDR family oxidoreductase n=1 Tax=Sphingomonas ginsenosidivorax TaxID=862135 RepID=UPI0018F3EF3B|nr:SDR family oxidoreductase [Sphingomonas ginsenosidivorax]
MTLKPLAEQVVVITGASSGIGRATAVMAAERGATVVIAARGVDALEALAAEIAQDGGRAVVIPCDVSDPDAVARLASDAVARCGRIDTWVNNAGVAIAARLEALPLADARRLFDVNFWGVVNGSLAALPYLDRQGGALINLGSFTSDVAAPYMGMYSASKAAIKGYTDALRIELMMDRRPVSVTLIKPAPIATPVLQHQLNLLDHQATMPPPFYRPDDVARTILYAAEHPVRDLFVGGAARFGSVFGQMLPGLADAGAALFARQIFKTSKPPTERPDNLYRPGMPAVVRGDTHGHVARRSVYTALRTRPGTSMAVAGAVLALGLLGFARRA